LLGHAESGYGRTKPSPETESGLSITVRVHDYVRLKRDTLERAESEVIRISREAGISTAWVDCPRMASELDQFPACLEAADSPSGTPHRMNDSRVSGVDGSAKPPADATASPPAHNNGNRSAASSGFNQLRNDFLTATRRVATAKKQTIAEVVEWASGGAFKYGDVGRMTEVDTAKLAGGH